MADNQAIDTGTAKAAEAPATAPANSAPRTASSAGPSVTGAGEQTTTNSATAEQSAKSLTGGVESDTVNNLVQAGIFKRMSAILGNTSAEVAEKIVTFGKKMWNSFVENAVVPIKNLNEILRRTAKWLTGGRLTRGPLKAVRNFVGNRLNRVSNRYKKIKNELLSGEQPSAANLGPGVTSTGSATIPPQQASSNKTKLSGVKSLRGAWRKATALRLALGIRHLPGSGNAAKNQGTARPTI